MANTLTNVIPQLLAQGLMALRENAIMPRLINHDYDKMAAQKGSTITIPVPSAISVADVTAAATPATNTQLAPTAVSIVMDQWKEAAFHLTDKEMMEVMSGTIPMQASEAIKALANTIDAAILGLYKGVYGHAGTHGTTPFASSTAAATEARKVLSNQLCPLGDRRMVINADAEANALGLRAFQDASFSGTVEAIRDGKITKKLGFDWFMDQNVVSHTNGSQDGAYLVDNATCAIGDSSTAIDTGSGTILEGDLFTVAGDTQVYVAGSGCTTTLLNFTPTMKVAWANNAAITFKGTASTAYPVNLAFHRDAFAFVSRPLADNTQGLGNMIMSATDKVSGIALRLEVSREHKRTRFSYDVLYGVKLVRAELAARLTG